MSSAQYRKFLPYLAIVAAGLFAYHNSFTGVFVFDDLSSIRDNSSIRSLRTAWSPPADVGVGGRPVVNLSLAMNYAFGGLNVWGYHLTNLIIHLLAGVTLFAFVRRTLLRPRLRGRFEKSATGVALTVAVIWIVHPLQTEAVTYLVQRVESLMGLFYLLTLYCFLRGAESERPSIWYALSVAACFCGMASKEVMVTAPVMVAVYDRIFVSGSFRQVWRRRWAYYLALAGTWGWLAWLMTGIHQRGVGLTLGVPWWQYGLTECRVIANYLRLAVWPQPLVFDYGTDIVTRFADVWPFVLILAVLLAANFVALRRWPVVAFAGIWVFGVLAPTSSIVPVTGSPMAEHRMYLPLAAVVVAVVIGGYRTLSWLARRNGLTENQRRLAACGLVGAIVLTLGWLTSRRNEVYRSEWSVWADTVAKQSQNPRAHCNLGTALLASGRIDEAIAHLRQALRLEPTYAGAYNNLGDALDQAGRVSEAITNYERAIQLKPDYPEAHNNLGVALKQTGRMQEAFSHVEQALRLRPNYANARVNLANLLFETGQLDRAVGEYRTALRLQPEIVEAHFNLGVLLSRTGRPRDAAIQFEQALRLKPGFQEARKRLTNLGSQPPGTYP